MTQADLTNLYKMRTVARLTGGSHRPHRPVRRQPTGGHHGSLPALPRPHARPHDLAADLESLLTAYDNERFELNKSLELARAHEGVNLILSSTNVRRGHCCPDADGRFVTEYDREARACRCDQRDAGILHDQNPLPF